MSRSNSFVNFSDPFGLAEQKYCYQCSKEYAAQETIQVNIKSEQNSPPTISGTCLLINSFYKIALNEAINCPLPPLHEFFFLLLLITAYNYYKNFLGILAISSNFSRLSMSPSTMTNHLLPYE